MKSYYYNIKKIINYGIELTLEDDEDPQNFEQIAIDTAEESDAIIGSRYETVCFDDNKNIVYQD